MHETITTEWHDQISVKALQNCTPEFVALAQECASAIAHEFTLFDGSMLTALLQAVDPNVFPNPDKVAYYKNSSRIHLIYSYAAQRNYFTSVTNLYFQVLGMRGGKVAPIRKGTHDKVCSYTSRYKSRLATTPRCRKAMEKLGWIAK